MNIRLLYRQIKEIQEKQGRKAITYVTVLDNYKRGKTIDEIVEIKAGSGGKREITGNKGKFKLTEKEFERAKYMISQGYHKNEVTKYFRVSTSYFKAHGI